MAEHPSRPDQQPAAANAGRFGGRSAPLPLLFALLAFQSTIDSRVVNASEPTIAARDSAVTIAEGLQVPDGFRVTWYADNNLTHDTYCLTHDSAGRAVVSGPGYVRTLYDDDTDGRADRFLEFADGPRTGAQGLFCDRNRILCVGDDGVWLYEDADEDGVADGVPRRLLKIRAGGEHHAHAIRRGPDGYWYLLAGNDSDVDERFVTLLGSPVAKSHAGVLLRLTPDFTGAEVIADGFRNAYDFDFHPQGDIFLYDSDGERDISLPWYRPTRVFQILPGSHAGWISRSWKRDDNFPSMPITIARLGRGRPTGAVCYRHTQFPESYHGAVFVLDWTYGRMVVLRPTRSGSVWQAKAELFMSARGQFGFAPTDVSVGPDGHVFVSVGGRGTSGGILRISWIGDGNNTTSTPHTDEPSPVESTTTLPRASSPTESADRALDRCLQSNQPLASWSRSQWMPLATALGPLPFRSAILSADRPVTERIRACEVLTEMFGGLDPTVALSLADPEVPAELRARVAWSLGRSMPTQFPTEGFRHLLSDTTPIVRRATLEALLSLVAVVELDRLVDPLAACLADEDRAVRMAASRVSARLPEATFRHVADAAAVLGWQAVLANAFAYLEREPGFNLYAFDVAVPILRGGFPPELQRDALALIQLGLGDVGPIDGAAAVFDGYHSRIDLSAYDRVLAPLAEVLTEMYPTRDPAFDDELSRLLAIMQPNQPRLLDGILAEIHPESSPVRDTHQLIVAARLPVARSSVQTQQIAAALLDLDAKIETRELKQDLNWDDRVGETYAELCRRDPLLPATIAALPQFGRPGHVQFVGEMEPAVRQQAVAAFVRRIQQQGDDYRWDSEVVFLLGETRETAYRELIRQQFDNLSVQPAVLTVLTRHPSDRDRPIYVAGLQSAQPDLLAKCLGALESLEADDRPDEQVALLRAMRSLGESPPEMELREEMLRLLQRNNGQNFTHQKANPAEVTRAWTEWIARRYPAEWSAAEAELKAGIDAIQTRLADVPWNEGSAHRGEKLFQMRACARCHGGHRAVGPALDGVAQRFSRQDLFTAIAVPSRDVSPRYQTTMIVTTEGRVLSGLVVYESTDGLLLRDTAGQTFRVESSQIEMRRLMRQSLMPNGLLDGLQPRDLADLYAYLSTLGQPAAAVSANRPVE